MSNVTFAEKMQKIDRRILYIILIIATSGMLFVPVTIPAKPDTSSAAAYVTLAELDNTKPVLIQSDWTQSTRGENMGHTEALLRILMSRNIKFVMQSLADPQAPQVFRDTMRVINDERRDAGLTTYEKGVDWIDLGYFSNAEASTQAIKNNVRTAWSGRKTKTPTGEEVDIFRSPLLEDVNRVEDFSAIILITASNTIDIAIQRLSGQLPILCFCTGVMGPQILPYYQSGQVSGVAIGLKGVYDMESMMDGGVNWEDPETQKTNRLSDLKASIPDLAALVNEDIPNFESPPDGAEYGTTKTFGRGQAYYAALHAALILMILAVIIGNVGMQLSKKKGGRR